MKASSSSHQGDGLYRSPSSSASSHHDALSVPCVPVYLRRFAAQAFVCSSRWPPASLFNFSLFHLNRNMCPPGRSSSEPDGLTRTPLRLRTRSTQDLLISLLRRSLRYSSEALPLCLPDLHFPGLFQMSLPSDSDVTRLRKDCRRSRGYPIEMSSATDSCKV
jgi:hypothetical protein